MAADHHHAVWLLGARQHAHHVPDVCDGKGGVHLHAHLHRPGSQLLQPKGCKVKTVSRMLQINKNETLPPAQAVEGKRLPASCSSIGAASAALRGCTGTGGSGPQSSAASAG